jgi:hypothetical protein
MPLLGAMPRQTALDVIADMEGVLEKALAASARQAMFKEHSK